MQTSYPTHAFKALMAGGILALAGSGTAFGLDTYNASTRQLTIPSLAIGAATYSDVVVTVGNVLKPPSGSAPDGSTDSFNPSNGQLTVQAVVVGSTTYYNVVASVAGLVSIGAVTGADTYDGTDLAIGRVQAGGTTYHNVVIRPGTIIRVAGGMPTYAVDTFNAPTDEVAIPAVQVGSHVYTNVLITAAGVVSIGGPSATASESVAYAFGSGTNASTDGVGPVAGLLQASDGNYYGSTEYGGSYGGGVIFSLSSAGVETILHSFSGNGLQSGSTDGAYPKGRLVQGSDGTLYGTTEYGGLFDLGSVFSITPTGTLTVLYSFGTGGGTDGAYPYAGLTFGNDGLLYGATYDGGVNGVGTVFRVDPATGTESVLYSFSGDNGVAGSTDGAYPYAALVLGSDGNFYGTTYGGGQYGALGGVNGLGTVFSITPAGVETVLHSFSGDGGISGSADGAYPVAGLVKGSDGNFYGTTAAGGVSTPGAGTVFRITPGGSETVLYSFGSGGTAGSTDGVGPAGLVIGTDGNFYSTTAAGGAYGQGTVFKVTSTGVETVLYSFSGNGGISGSVDGASPEGGVIEGTDGKLHGTTSAGGAGGIGAVFSIVNAVPAN